ncbi:maltodextrin glucosidase [Photorhabdus tasmaniensis]|uniref:Maltodextrin glucosidase n=1 Tax=Photorhabdus tasmaniensis TaxID=1004159 RepID=A0ABX0GJB1_9GAMM|nr:maltodextrin glucosidase [Photorhabdus tasmaniensis]NHB89329.1 maltodextrin glucosidase [Photorhabdus tasmaniensis]
MTILFIYHGQTPLWVKRNTTSITLTICTENNSDIDKVFARCEPDNEQKLFEMTPFLIKIRLKYWQTEIPYNTDKPQTLYCFKILTRTSSGEEGQIWLHAKGTSSRIPGREYHFRCNINCRPPEWVADQVVYQIFPDRFANGNPDISVRQGEYNLYGDDKRVVVKAWGDAVSDHDTNGACEFYGGDIVGIRNKLNYLQELGVTTLYLNPIFTAPSNHKYDTVDYFNIDPHLGGNEEFAKFTAELHRRGMKVLLDAVFNHTSLDHPWFNRFSKHTEGEGAWQSPSSPYRDYYIFEGDNYFGWNGYETLPKLNYKNQDVQNYFYKGERSVVKHWLKAPYHIDGWRFDAIHMLGEGKDASNNSYYIKELRNAAKTTNPDALVMGEHFHEATSWLQGEQEDCAMNYYGFLHPIRLFLAKKDITYHSGKINAEELYDWLNEAISKIPWDNQLCQFNQLDSHDTVRFITLLNGDETKMRIALSLLFCWPGVPCIYYGTELSLEGGEDPDNRRCMPWDKARINHSMLSFIRQLAFLRHRFISLRRGNLQWLFASNDTLAFARHIQTEKVICIINAGDEEVSLTLQLWQIDLDEGLLIDALEATKYTINNGELFISLVSKSFLILHNT